MLHGNTLMDCYTETSAMRCCKCEGTGRVAFEDHTELCEALDHERYLKAKRFQPAPTFREWLTIARGMKAEGKRCPDCDGNGELV
jgi:hypothetical protein